MKTNFYRILKVTFALLLINLSLFGQSFEGSISYKVVALNPNPEMITDSMWQEGLKEQFGEKGYMLQKTFYKAGNYMSEIAAGEENGFQTYNPENGLIYSWQSGAEVAVTVDSKKSMDEFVEVISSDETETILGIICNSVTLKSKLGEMTLWYNKDHLKMDPSFYKDHLYGHLKQTVNEIECIPLKIVQKGFMGHISMTAMEFEKLEVSDDKFKIPEFKETSASPMN